MKGVNFHWMNEAQPAVKFPSWQKMNFQFVSSPDLTFFLLLFFLFKKKKKKKPFCTAALLAGGLERSPVIRGSDK